MTRPDKKGSSHQQAHLMTGAFIVQGGTFHYDFHFYWSLLPHFCYFTKNTEIQCTWKNLLIYMHKYP